MYTVDASVFLNAYDATEVGHDVSRRFLDMLQGQAALITVPTLILAEVAAALSRTRGDAMRAYAFADALRQIPHLTLLPLTVAEAQHAAGIAARQRLRGADAVYVAAALQCGGVLVTLDREQHDRVVGIVPVRYPAEVLEQ